MTGVCPVSSIPRPLQDAKAARTLVAAILISQVQVR